MLTRTVYIFIIAFLLMACSRPQQESYSQAAARCLEEAEAALFNDSIQVGETLLRKAIRLSEQSEDWHTNYIAYQRLAEAFSQSNPEEAYLLMEKAIAIYEQHPDDERNYVMLLDYAGTYAAQEAFTTDRRMEVERYNTQPPFSKWLGLCLFRSQVRIHAKTNRQMFVQKWCRSV